MAGSTVAVVITPDEAVIATLVVTDTQGRVLTYDVSHSLKARAAINDLLDLADVLPVLNSQEVG